MRKKKIMAMVFAAMMMVASFTATSSEQWENCSSWTVFCTDGGVYSVLVCGDSQEEEEEMAYEWLDILCS
jgi:hypothetical protein